MVKSVLVWFIAVLLTGCGGPRPLWDDIEKLKQENTDLTMQIQTLQEKNIQLAGQVDTLSAFDKTVRMEDIETLDKIDIGKFTGLYDQDKDGANETLVVYVEPLDTAQDYVKAIGTAHVQLWNLDADAAEAKLADWTLDPVQLQELWGGNIFASYYRLPFDVGDILTGQEKQLTVKVTFTDYLSGKVLSAQTTITP